MKCVNEAVRTYSLDRGNFHLSGTPKGHTHFCTPLCTWSREHPAFFYSSVFVDARRLMSTSPSHLSLYKATPFTQRSLGVIPCIYHWPGLQSAGGNTTPPSLPHSSVLPLPAVAHRLSKPRSNYSHCWGLKGRLGGGRCWKELCLFKRVFKKREGDLLNAGSYGSSRHNRTMRRWSSSAEASAEGLLGIPAAEAPQTPPKLFNTDACVCMCVPQTNLVCIWVNDIISLYLYCKIPSTFKQMDASTQLVLHILYWPTLLCAIYSFISLRYCWLIIFPWTQSLE